MHSTDDSLLTPKQVAHRLAVPVGSLTNWRYTGVGPRYIKLGRLVRYRAADVEAWVDAQTREASKAS